MANMSYCRFENTLRDLRDCFSAMEDSIDFDPTEDQEDFPDGEMLSADETAAKNSLIELCQRIVNKFGEDA